MRSCLESKIDECAHSVLDAPALTPFARSAVEECSQLASEQLHWPDTPESGSDVIVCVWTRTRVYVCMYACM